MKHKLSQSKIKAILIDSGKVLNEPATGHWFITPNFFNYIDKGIFNSIDSKQRDDAFSCAGDYISKQNMIVSEEEEFKHFFEYYRIFSQKLPQLNIGNGEIKAVAEDLVYNYSKYRFYGDAVSIIPELYKKYKLAVVSDAWPSLENVFIKAGMRDYFSSFVISSLKGVNKPHPLMYRTALEELNVSPDEAVFIDDNVKNCDGALGLGIPSFLLCRDWKSYFYNRVHCKNHAVIRNLYEIKRLLV